jgi:HAE1 family hydrophobic/amphiphilic exporter-1
MAVAVLLVYVMMVLAFDSLVTPFIILFSLPLAMIGAFPALAITGRPIGVSALIGMLMLIGIVVTNAIVLLDLVERLRREGHPTSDALIEGGKTRVRPILMTAIATILALIPLAAGFNEGSIIAAELGTVVIGGLFSSTFLTLLVVPVVYSLIDGARVGVARRRRSAAVKAGGPEAAPAG